MSVRVDVLEPRTSRDLGYIVREFPTDRAGGYLFRGQTKDHVLNGGLRAYQSSIERKGCLPPLMLKWSFCATQILQALKGPGEPAEDHAVLALLQHYGWRTFFLDLTAGFQVAAWFAAHRYRDERQIRMVETYSEDPIIEVHRAAQYESSDEPTGVVYVFDRNVVEQDQGLQLYDVSSGASNGSLRGSRQQAWAVMAKPWGSLTPRMNKALTAVVKAPVPLLSDVASEAGLTQSHLFPSSESDDVMRLLLSLPRILIPMRDDAEPGPLGPAYQMGLDLPEYAEPFQKRYPPRIAYDQNNWFSDLRAGLKSEGGQPWRSSTFVRVDQSAFFGVPRLRVAREGQAVLKLLDRLHDFIIEVSTLIPVYPDMLNAEYVMGARARTTDGLVEVSPIFVTHRGTNCIGGGESYGRFYQVDENGFLLETNHVGSCPCKNESKHDLLVSTIKRIAIALSEDGANLIEKEGHLYVNFRSGSAQPPLLARRGYGIEAPPS